MSYSRYLRMATPAATGTPASASPNGTPKNRPGGAGGASGSIAWRTGDTKMMSSITSTHARTKLAYANHLSWARSSPRARRRRSARHAAPATNAASIADSWMSRPTWTNEPPVSGPNKSSSRGTWVVTGPRSSPTVKNPTTMFAGVSHTMGRQRGDSNRPSGNRRNRSDTSPNMTTQVLTSQAMGATDGGEPGAGKIAY